MQVVDTLQKGHQAMVFVHSRKDTGKSARMLQMKAQQGGETAAFDCQEEDGWHFMQQEIDKSKNRFPSSLAYPGCVLRLPQENSFCGGHGRQGSAHMSLCRSCVQAKSACERSSSSNADVTSGCVFQ